MQSRAGWVALAALSLAATTATAPRLGAQSDTAQISGYVKDASGGVVPGVTVVAMNEVTGLARQSQTNENGYYVTANLPPGFYTIAAEAEGFKRYVKTQVKLDANLATTADLTLEIGALTETVELACVALTWCGVWGTPRCTARSQRSLPERLSKQ